MSRTSNNGGSLMFGEMGFFHITSYLHWVLTTLAQAVLEGNLPTASVVYRSTGQY